MNFAKYVLLLFLSGFLGLSHGASLSYGLNVNNIYLDSSIDWATVTITDNGEDIDFLVEMNTDAFDDLGVDTYLFGNFGMQDFFFNSSVELSADNIIYNDPVEWNFLTDREYNAGGGFGKFGLEYSGTGDTRADPLSFTIRALYDNVYTYALENDEGYAFASHIADFDGPGDITSGKFSTSLSPVPIPAAGWLFGSALLGFVGFARRRSV